MPTQFATSGPPVSGSAPAVSAARPGRPLLARIPALTDNAPAARLLSLVSFLVATLATFALVAGLFWTVFVLDMRPGITTAVFAAATILGAGLITALARIGELYAQRARDIDANNVYKSIAATARSEPYALFLRPFASTGQIEVDSTAPTTPGMSIPLSENIELEGQIERAVRPSGQLIALGHSLEHVGAGRITVSEQDWRSAIRSLMDHARLIVMLPSARAGTLEEIDMILSSSLREKTVFLDPPNLEKSGDYSHADEWNQVRNAFDKHGLKLPAETREGRLLFFHNDNAPILIERLDIESEFRVARFFRRVRKHIRTTGNKSEAQGLNP